MHGEQLLRFLEEQTLLGDEAAHQQLHWERLRRQLPVFNHDCDACIFLGTIKIDKDSRESCFPFHLDLYVCNNSDVENSESRSVFGPTLLARYSDEGSHYASQDRNILYQIEDEWTQHQRELSDTTKILLEANYRALLLGI